MKKYYYKNESGDVYTNDPNVFDTNTKPITACYSGRFYRHGIDNDMVDTYKKEFGENVLPGSKFSIWVDDMLHYIITSTSPDIIDHIPSEYKSELIARNILVMLAAQKPNKYLDKIIAHLKEYYL